MRDRRALPAGSPMPRLWQRASDPAEARRCVSREVKKLGQPAAAPHMIDWNWERAGISAEMQGSENPSTYGRCPNARFSAWWRGRELSPANTAYADAASDPASINKAGQAALRQ